MERIISISAFDLAESLGVQVNDLDNYLAEHDLCLVDFGRHCKFTDDPFIDFDDFYSNEN